MARLEHEIVTAPDLAEDGDVTLLVPEADVAEPELSIVIPALNEEPGWLDFLAGWIRQARGAS